MVSCPLFSGGAFLVFWKKIADGRLAIAHSGPSDVAGWSMVEGGVLYPRQSTVPMQTGYRCFSARRDPSQRSQRRCRMVDGRRRCVVPASIDGADANGISLLLGPAPMRSEIAGHCGDDAHGGSHTESDGDKRGLIRASDLPTIGFPPRADLVLTRHREAARPL